MSLQDPPVCCLPPRSGTLALAVARGLSSSPAWPLQGAASGSPWPHSSLPQREQSGRPKQSYSGIPFITSSAIFCWLHRGRDNTDSVRHLQGRESAGATLETSYQIQAEGIHHLPDLVTLRNTVTNVFMTSFAIRTSGVSKKVACKKDT